LRYSKFPKLASNSSGFLLGCQDSSRCQCSLILINNRNDNDQTLVVGDDKPLNISLKVINNGNEPSFNASMSLFSDFDLPLIKNCINTTSTSNPEAGSVSSKIIALLWKKNYFVFSNKNIF
jgi:hypothetical protein